MCEAKESFEVRSTEIWCVRNSLTDFQVLTHVSPAKPSRRPTKDRSCPMTPNTSSNVGEPSQSEFLRRQSDMDVELTGRVVTLNPIQSVNWKNLTTSSDSCDLSIFRERPKNFSLLPRQHLLEVRRDDPASSAPLASPEVLSETSSLASFGSGGGSVRQSSGYQRLTSGTARMDPIKQSPLCQPIHTRGYCLMLEPPVDKKGETMGVNCITLSPLSDVQDVLDRSSDHVDDLTRDEMLDREADGNEESCLIPVVKAVCDAGNVLDGVDHLGDIGQCSNHVADVEVHTQHGGDTTSEDVARRQSCDFNSAEVASVEGLAGSLDGADMVTSSAMESLELEVKRRNLVCGAPALIGSDRDSVESGFGRQYLYDDYADHYSPAGRGYPHGLSHSHANCQASLTIPSLDGSGSYLSASDGNDSEGCLLPSGDESYGSCIAINRTEGNGGIGPVTNCPPSVLV